MVWTLPLWDFLSLAICTKTLASKSHIYSNLDPTPLVCPSKLPKDSIDIVDLRRASSEVLTRLSSTMMFASWLKRMILSFSTLQLLVGAWPRLISTPIEILPWLGHSLSMRFTFLVMGCLPSKRRTHYPTYT
jgi:hypothetical protein